jgi:hypothetical protein
MNAFLVTQHPQSGTFKLLSLLEGRKCTLSNVAELVTIIYSTFEMTRWLISLAIYIAGVYNHSIECDNCQSICVQCKV